MLGGGLHQAGRIFFIPLPERSVVRSNLTGTCNLVKLRRVVHPPAVKNAWTCQTPDFSKYCVFIPRYTLFLRNAERVFYSAKQGLTYPQVRMYSDTGNRSN